MKEGRLKQIFIPWVDLYGLAFLGLMKYQSNIDKKYLKYSEICKFYILIHLCYICRQYFISKSVVAT